MYYAGEVEWCTDKGRYNWVMAVQELLDRNQWAFSEFDNDDGEHVMSYAGATCWFQAGWVRGHPVLGWDVSGPRDHFSHYSDYCHQHAKFSCDDGVQDVHEYPYNRVPPKENHNGEEWEYHHFGKYLAGAPNDWDHLLHHYPDWPEQDDPHNFHILHQSAGYNFDGYKVAGVGDLPGLKSIAAPSAERAGYTSAHELGHNYNGLHKEAECFYDPAEEVTLMGDIGVAVNDCGYSRHSWDRYPTFSPIFEDDQGNHGRIWTCLKEAYASDCTR